MVTGAGQVAGAVAVARKVVRVEACHLKKKKRKHPLLALVKPPEASHREVIMGKRRSWCLSFHS